MMYRFRVGKLSREKGKVGIRGFFSRLADERVTIET